LKILKFIIGYIYAQIAITIHKFWITYYTLKFCKRYKKITKKEKRKLFFRSFSHDWSKYSWIEAKGFATTIFDLKNSTYGSNEYKALLDKLKPSLNHHYKKNKHHPEYWKNGINGMSITNKIEMVIDWRSATRRHANGNIFESININQKRFGYSDEDKYFFIEIAEYLF
jgi:hypothetical protein